MEAIRATTSYWLVNQPTIKNFEWRRGITLGSSPLFLLLTVISYITLTLLLYSSRSHFRTHSLPLRPISTVYNLLTFTLSLVMAVGCGLSTLSEMPDPHWVICFPANHTPTRGPVFFWGYIFYLSKILEFTDTLLILLSKSSSRRRRLSFLHVFHHSMVLVMSYIWVDAPQSTFPLGVVINAMVHTVMYSYYLMCSLGVRPSWKKLVTNIQIIQFVVAFAVAAAALYYHLVKYRCSGSKYAWSFGFFFNTSLLYLFLDFYTTSYKNSQKMMKSKKGDRGKDL